MNKIKIIVDFLEERYGNKIDNHPEKNLDVFKVLIETILSQRTRDENTDRAANQLFSIAEKPEQILKLPLRRLQILIKSAGFYKQKAKRIKQVSKIILEKYKGKVPNNRKELMELPGVGYKTADIVLMYGFGKPAIAIDTHCNRVSKRIGLASLKDDVEKVKQKLESTFPKNKWYLINLGFVLFGREICQPRKPKCNLCFFKSFCSAYKTQRFDVKSI